MGLLEVRDRSRQRQADQSAPQRAHGSSGEQHRARNTWSTFARALGAYSAAHSPYSGIGFVVSADDPYTGVDLDHCPDGATGQLTAAARAEVLAFASYAELSPSGEGAHAWIRGRVARRFLSEGAQGCKVGDFEAYTGAHFLTVTGQQVDGTRATIADAQPALDAFCA